MIKIESVQAFLDGGTKVIWTSEGRYLFDYGFDAKNRFDIFFDGNLIIDDVLKNHIIKLKNACDTDSFGERIDTNTAKFIKKFIDNEYTNKIYNIR